MATDIVNNTLQRLIGEQINLPSPPTIAAQILKTIQNEESSHNDLEKIISMDPALTCKLLRIANSAFYALPYKVSNVNRAVSILGTNVIKNIALSFVIAGSLRGETDSSFDFEYFWRRSVTSAVAAELVTGLLQEKNEDIFVTALLQDIGVLIMFLNKDREYVATLEQCSMDRATDQIGAERKMYQFDHQQLGCTLLENWGIPQSIVRPIRYHHQPQLAPEEDRRTSSILYVANLLSIIYSNTETAETVRELQTKMADFFNITADQTRTLLDNVAEKSLDILKIFEIDSGQLKPYSQMLQEANDELGKLNLSYEHLVLELKESKEKSERFANELRKANIRLEELAYRDGLTGLYNHRYFQEALSKEMIRTKRYKHSLSLIMFDIDFFKEVNDTHGHPAGDQVLINLAQAISAAVRPSDILTRYGGEEFAVVLPETTQTGLKVFAERLRRCAEAVTTIHKQAAIKITISCGGVHLSPHNHVMQQELIHIADRGLFLSKKNGRNRVTILPIESIAN
ncbi:sensor domain-containing diguanylate cyclase [Desulfocastanea catecholica]